MRRRYQYRHPFHHLYVLKDSVIPVRIECERVPPKRATKRAVFRWRLFVGNVDQGDFKTFTAAEAAIPADVFARVA